MELTMLGVARYEKLDTILRHLLREPDACLPEADLSRCAPGMDKTELEEQKQILLQDGAICVLDKPEGPYIFVTEEGIDFYVCGGYSRDWSKWAEFKAGDRRQRQRKTGRMIWVLIGLIILAICLYKIL